MINKHDLGIKLTSKRKAAGLSTYRLEKISTLNRSQISAIENGTANYTIDTLIEYCKHCKVDFMLIQKLS